VIKKILRTRLKTGFIFNTQIKKDPGNVITGFKAFKVDKRNDGWIEIRDAETWDLFGLVKRFETSFGALYLGFGLDKRPIAFFRPYKSKISNVRKVVREINRRYRFIKLSWCSIGGNEKAKLFNFRVEIVNLFNFILFLAPLPQDVLNIVSQIKRPKKFGIKIIDEIFYLPWHLIEEKRLKGSQVIREVIKLFTGKVLLVKKIIKYKRGKREILGGYIPTSLPLIYSRYDLKLKNDVCSIKAPMVMVCIQGGFAEILQLQTKKERGSHDRPSKPPT
jgi:hypothetical protein